MVCEDEKIATRKVLNTTHTVESRLKSDALEGDHDGTSGASERVLLTHWSRLENPPAGPHAIKVINGHNLDIAKVVLVARLVFAIPSNLRTLGLCLATTLPSEFRTTLSMPSLRVPKHSRLSQRPAKPYMVKSQTMVLQSLSLTS